jgi:putative spermidine/putrescine transport system permease protein
MTSISLDVSTTAYGADKDPALAHGARQLKARLRKAERMGQIRAYVLIAPLLAFLLFSFLLPIGNLLIKSVHDPLVSTEMPRTAQALKGWNPKLSELPDESAFAALAEDLLAGKSTGGATKVAMRLNFESSGMRSLVIKTARQLEGGAAVDDWQRHLTGIDARWGEKQTWSTLKRTSSPWTLDFYLKALDLERNADGDIVQQPQEQRIYKDVFVRTVWVGLLVSGLCLLIAYPVAYFLANIPARYGNVLMIMVLLPFWTSFLVRSISWIVVLQGNGILNGMLACLGLSENGWQLIYNRWGVLISMTHILLPYAILSLYSVMKSVPPIYMRAARSLGAGPIRSFWRVYFPHTLPGVAAALLLTFILAVGYYITPAMLGGPDDQLVSYYIANHVNSTLNWGLACALATGLLVGVMCVYAIFSRLTGGNGVKLG